MCGPGCCRRETLKSPKMLFRNEVARCLSEITRRCRYSKSYRRHIGVPVSGRLNASNLYSTGKPRCCDSAAMKGADRKYVRLLLEKRPEN